MYLFTGSLKKESDFGRAANDFQAALYLAKFQIEKGFYFFTYFGPLSSKPCEINNLKPYFHDLHENLNRKPSFSDFLGADFWCLQRPKVFQSLIRVDKNYGRILVRRSSFSFGNFKAKSGYN